MFGEIFFACLEDSNNCVYFSQVIKDLGLCISVYDIQALEGGFVFAGDGAPTYTVRIIISFFALIPLSANMF